MRKVMLLTLFIAWMMLSSCNPANLSFDKMPYLTTSKVLFQDDFSDEQSGWLIGSSVYDLKAYSPEGFMILVNAPHTKSWSLPGMRFSDISLSVTARKLAGPENNSFGVLCRFQDSHNYYSFLVGSDGYYGVVKVLNGTETLLGSPVMDYSVDILPFDAENNITAECSGDTLSLTVNDTLLISVQDSDLSYGDVGLVVESRDEGDLAMLFNNFLVETR